MGYNEAMALEESRSYFIHGVITALLVAAGIAWGLSQGLVRAPLRVILSPTHRRPHRRWPLSRYARLAEVGMTRKGSGFGKGTNYIECVVTGGTGTIAACTSSNRCELAN